MIRSLLENNVFTVFLIAALGYMLGSIKIRGLSLGTAGILIVALIFGHFEIEVPSIVQNIGLVAFVCSVGFMAGPTFFRNFKWNVGKYVILGVSIILAGALTCFLVIKVGRVSADLAMGLMAGALTTTPGLAAAIEATGSDMVSVGYGIAYPFGVISVVMFVQLMPRFLKVDMADERRMYLVVEREEAKTIEIKLLSCDSRGFFGFALAIVLGVIIGRISIPLPGGVGFSLGTSGGPLLMGIILGHFGRIGKLDVSVKSEVLVTMREFGLALFLIGAGTHAGTGFIEVLARQGIILLLYGALISIIPMVAGYAIAKRILHMNLLDALGSICGGMTSTPALGTLIHVAGTEDVASAYAATYPIALAMIVLTSQLMGKYL